MNVPDFIAQLVDEGMAEDAEGVLAMLVDMGEIDQDEVLETLGISDASDGYRICRCGGCSARDKLVFGCRTAHRASTRHKVSIAADLAARTS
jgi:hypothetical protein